jgi:hypothetical protein
VTIRGRHRLAASVLLAVVGTACGGGERVHATAGPRAQPVVARDGPSHPAPGLPRPGVVDRGTDVAGVARSLLLFGRWLAWRDPDPALVARAYQPGSPPARIAARDVAELRRTGARIVEVDRAPLELVIISRTPNVVSFRLTEHLAHRELIAASGRVLRSDAARTERYVVSIMRSRREAPWRLNLFERAAPKIEVQL